MKSSQLIAQPQGLKRTSDALVVLSVVALVVAIVTGQVLVYVVAAVLFLGSIGATALKRQRAKSRHAAKAATS